MTGKLVLTAGILMILLTNGCTAIPAAKLSQIRQAVGGVVPEGARVEVSTSPRALARPAVVVSAHLLEGYPANDSSPYVRGNYGTQELLEELVRERSTVIYQAILQQVSLDGISELRVRCRHGVRWHYGSWGVSSDDQATTIYETALPVPAAGKLQSAVATPAEIQASWHVSCNAIPSLRIVAVP